MDYVKNVQKAKDRGLTTIDRKKNTENGRKLMLAVWLDHQGINYLEFVKRNETINSNLYV